MKTASPKSDWAFWAAWAFWLLSFAAITTDVIRHPLDHTTMPTYRLASTQWWQGIDPYSTNEHAGFLYFPQAAVLFTPFNVVPFYVGEVLWRAVVFGLFAYALVRLARFFLSDNEAPSTKTFLVLSLLAVPSSLASLRNAQFDLPLAAFIVLATAEIASARWAAAAAWLGLALALKPLAVVPMLLFGTLYGKFVPRAIVAMLIVIALPFLHWNPAFVAHEYARCYETLMWATKANEPRYSDLFALLAHVGVYPPDLLKTSLRVLFAAVYFGLGCLAVRKLKPIEAAWMVGALSADYLMLFNPRTETCSYVFLGPWVASLALLDAGRPSQKWLGYALGFAALCLACDGFPRITHTLDIHMWTDRWLKPLIALLFLPVMVLFVFEKGRDASPFASPK